MCSWCWAFKPCFDILQERLPESVQVRMLLGGLAKDTDEPMPEDMRLYLQQTWKDIQLRVPGTQFNFDFWQQCSAVRSTYRACRAVIAARLQGDHFEAIMIDAIQKAYYLQARNPAKLDVLVELAVESGLEKEVFENNLIANDTDQQLQFEINTSRGYGVDSFPSLILDVNGARWRIPINYVQPMPMLDTINQIMENQDK